MASTRRTIGNLADNSDGQPEKGPVLPNEQQETTLDNLMSNVDSGDLLCITRTAPWGHEGYLGTISWDPSIDLLEEMANAFGGKNYKIQVKKRTKTGQWMYARGCAYVTIAGDPKPVRRASELAPMPTPPALATAGAYPAISSVGADLQGRLLDILSEKLKTPAENLGEVVKSITDALQTPQQGNQLEQLLATVETGRKLGRLFAPQAEPEPRYRNPREDDDEEESDPMDKLFKMGMMYMMSNLMGKGQQAQAPMQGVPQPVRMPPGPPPEGCGWYQDATTGQWILTRLLPRGPRSSEVPNPSASFAQEKQEVRERTAQKWEVGANGIARPAQNRASQPDPFLATNPEDLVSDEAVSIKWHSPMVMPGSMRRPPETIVPNPPRGGTIEGGVEGHKFINGSIKPKGCQCTNEPSDNWDCPVHLPDKKCICVGEAGSNEDCPVCYEPVALDDATVDELADTIEALSDEEKQELYMKLAPKLGLG